MITPFYGEKNCQAFIQKSKLPCQNKAYFISNQTLLCGVHSKKIENKQTLPINPNKAQIKEQKIQQMFSEIENEAKLNQKNGKQGNVVVAKMLMMKQPNYKKGYLNVFPNFKHQHRKDGFGCCRLSPKSLGPVIHQMPHLPDSKNLENFHQFSKFWKFELDENNSIKEQYLQNRIKAYLNTQPFRHKYDRQTLLSTYNTNNKNNININIPQFSMYYDQNGNEKRYNYIECRFFYCHFYEYLVQNENDYKELKQKIKDGYNLQIVGYDGYPVIHDLYTHYLDESKPFGHELVLYSMLVEENHLNYPWNIYYQKYPEKYENVITMDEKM